jgi:protein FAM32A
MADQYAQVVKSSLKLKSKGAQDAGIRKKKHKKAKSAATENERNAETESMQDVLTKKPTSSESSSRAATSKTKAELKFQEMQEKRQMDRILKKAEKTHKQRVEDFNKHLDSLSEHYDIPKVSWTK